MIFATAQSASHDASVPQPLPVETDPDKVVNLRNAGFATTSVRRHTNRGTPYWLEEPFGVPKIPTAHLRGVFYLYRDREAAEAGEKYGGTGFIVGVPAEVRPNSHFLYAVSNWHVAVQKGFSVIRLNTEDGPPEIIELGPEQWEFDPETGHDIAIAAIPMALPAHCKFSLVETRSFITRDWFGSPAVAFPIGVGDDTFMVGRFVDHDGGPTNQPAARFGHISIGPSKLRGVFNKDVEMICLDTNSRTGFSGSPVYVYRTSGGDLEQALNPQLDGKIVIHTRPVLLLLGVHTGQFPEWWTAEPGGGSEADDMEEVAAGQVRGLSGMTRVAPAWGIVELLNSPKFSGQREAARRRIRDQESTGPAITASGED